MPVSGGKPGGWVPADAADAINAALPVLPGFPRLRSPMAGSVESLREPRCRFRESVQGADELGVVVLG
jgi:hypothetical protein